MTPNSKSRPTAAISRSTLQLQSIDTIVQNPLDVFARVAFAEAYEAERISDHDLHLSLPGLWSDHHVSLSWKEGEALLQMYLVFDFNVPKQRAVDMCGLISLLNARLAIGHFDFWAPDSALVYRQSMLLSGETRLTAAQAMGMVSAALDAAEKGYPAAQYLLWASKSAADAIDQALLDRAAFEQSETRQSSDYL